MKLSVVVCLYNEEENIRPLVKALTDHLGGSDAEFILVDDGSNDRTVAEIKSLVNDKVKLLALARNYGQTYALKAGIDYATGEYIAIMDGDLQNDPSDIAHMLETLQNSDFDVVIGKRANRQDGMVLRKIPSMIANYLIRKSTGVPSKDLGCTLRVFKSKFAKNLELHGELHRFISLLAHINGAKILEVDVKHHPRRHGESKYGLSRSIKVLSDLALMLFMQRYLPRPIHLFGMFGSVTLGAGMLGGVYLTFTKVFGSEIGGRPLLLLVVLLIVAGIQFFSLGIMLEILMRNYYSKDRKSYNVREFTGEYQSQSSC